MRTLSHAVLAAASSTKPAAKRGDAALFPAGSVLPDAPLFVLSTVTILLSPSQSIGMERMHLNYKADPL